MATTTKIATCNTIVDSATIQNFLKAKVTLSYTKSVTGRKLWRSFNGYKYTRLNKSQVAQCLAKFGLTIDTYLAAQKQWCDAQVAKACAAIDAESNDIVDDYIVTPSAGLVALLAELDAAYKAERAAQEAINARINEARKLFKELAANSPIVVNSFTDAWDLVSKFVFYAPFEFSYEYNGTRFFFCPEFDNPFYFAENFTEDGSFYSVEIKYGLAGNKPITIQIQPVDTQQVAIDAEEHSAKAQGNTSTTPAFETGNVYLLNTSSMSAIPIMRKFKCLKRSNAYVSITQYLEDKQIYSPYPERYKIRNGSDGEFIEVSIIEHLYPRTLFAKDLVERDTATPLTDNQKQAAHIVDLIGKRIVKFSHAGDGHNGGLALHYDTFNDEQDEFGSDLSIVEVFTDQSNFILDHVNLIKGFGDNKTVTQFFFDKPVQPPTTSPKRYVASYVEHDINQSLYGILDIQITDSHFKLGLLSDCRKLATALMLFQAAVAQAVEDKILPPFIATFIEPDSFDDHDVEALFFGQGHEPDGTVSAVLDYDDYGEFYLRLRLDRRFYDQQFYDQPPQTSANLNDSLERAMTFALDRYKDFCHTGQISRAEHELVLYNICRKLRTRCLRRRHDDSHEYALESQRGRP